MQAHAELVVSGVQHLLVLSPFRETPILKPREFLRNLSSFGSRGEIRGTFGNLYGLQSGDVELPSNLIEHLAVLTPEWV